MALSSPQSRGVRLSTSFGPTNCVSNQRLEADMPSPAHRAGLEGVIVADSRLSEVDGERGRLVIAGSDVEDLAGRISFEDLAHRLWSLYLPDSSPDRIRTELGEARLKAFALIPTLGDALEAQDGMDALRAAVSHLRESGPLPLQSNIWVTAATGVFAAAWAAKLQGGRPVPPDRSAGHAADILRMATGEKSPTKAKGFESYLVTVSDHGMNASTFTARVIASTASDIVSSVLSKVHSTAVLPARSLRCWTPSVDRSVPPNGSRPRSPRVGASWAWGIESTGFEIREPRCWSKRCCNWSARGLGRRA